ncbi:hypothetical protein [Alkaliphilus transvaalensis]|uniref:hypothetical protein n=1 Tax=Alkaliphilus transvaalensis TaxID=114628 RepID=UPI00047A7067|nr:hypothetical protein [Alkaliphilus transvaalensis]
MKHIDGMIAAKSEFDHIVKEILESPRYRHLGNGRENGLDELRKWLVDWLSRLLERLSSNEMEISPVVADRLSVLALIIGLVFITTIVVFIAVKLNKTFEKNDRVKEILGEKIDDLTTPNSLRAKAEEIQLQGDFRLAVRYDFIALLLLLHRSKIIYLNEAKTNEEIYRCLIEGNFKSLEEIKWLINTFNSVWYGLNTFTENQYKDWNHQFNRLWNEVLKDEG